MSDLFDTPAPPPVRRPLTEREQAQLAALQRCTLLPGSWDKRFIRSVGREVTEKQAPWIERLAWKYRRQMPKDLVPDTQPEKPK